MQGDITGADSGDLLTQGEFVAFADVSAPVMTLADDEKQHLYAIHRKIRPA